MEATRLSVTSTGKESRGSSGEWGVGAVGTWLGHLMLPSLGEMPTWPRLNISTSPDLGEAAAEEIKLPREKGCVSVCQSKELYSPGKRRASPASLSRSWRGQGLATAPSRSSGPRHRALAGPWALCRAQAHLAPARNLSTRGGGASSSRSPGSSYITHILLLWGSNSEHPAKKARRGQEREDLRPGGRQKGGLASGLRP